MAATIRSFFMLIRHLAGLLLADSVEKVLCGAHAHFLKAADALDAVGCGGPVQSTQDRSAIS
jgi:hypothetical protein